MSQDAYNHFPYQTADPVYYGQLKEWAKENRKNPTMAEYNFKEEVRCNRLGHKFLFQHIIGQYIVDFLCPDFNLVVEIDGGYHERPDQKFDDEARTAWLEKMGYKVIRFTNEQVFTDIENVIDEIKNNLKQT